MGRHPKTDKKVTPVFSGSSLQSKKIEAVRLAMEQITKSYGEGAIMKMGDKQADMTVEVIPTGCLPLDVALGVGGLPRGRVTEIFGPEASGKTTICLHVIKEAQRLGGTAAFIDAEHALDPSRARTIGVDLDSLLISQPDNGEQALEIVETLVRSNAVDVIVIDSVAALVPKAEIEGEMGDSMMGLQARLMSQALRKLTGAISKSKAVVIFTNQMRQKIGVMFGNPETTTGGLALKFYSSIRIDVRKIANIKTPAGESIGSQHRARIIKNKVAPPFKEAEFDIMNTEGISVNGSLVDMAIQYGFITKSGAFFKVSDQNIQGREGTKNYLHDNSKAAADLTQKIWEAVRNPDTKKVAKTEE
jgi:recombination protein RecA